MHQLTGKRQRLQARARILQTIRAFFIQADFLEIETPQRIPQNAPEAYIQPFESEGWQLQTSPELAMKRLLAAGYEKIFQICHCWRTGERGRRHLPEFTLLEWYRSHCDYLAVMDDCENLLAQLTGGQPLRYQGNLIRCDRPFERLSVHEAFARYTSLTPEQALKDDCFDELMVTAIEPNLGLPQPTFLYDYPASLAALARRKPANPCLAERFELYVAGIELANAFSELTDATEQRQRFEHVEQRHSPPRSTPMALPEKFLAALPQMPAAAGIALGIDRLVMLLTNAARIDQVVSFTPEEL